LSVRSKNLRLAIALGLVALAVYVAYVLLQLAEHGA
jgi:uncharacterized membrane protein (DUF485 family)